MVRPDPLYMLRGSSHPITALCPISQSESNVRPSQSKLVTGTQSGAIYLWNLGTRRITWRCEDAHSQAILGIHCNDGIVWTQGRDGVIRKWTLKDDILEENGQIGYDVVGFCPMVVDDHFICVTSNKSTGQLDLLATCDRCHGSLVVKETSERKYGMAMVARKRNNLMFVGYEDGSVAMWSLLTSAMLSRRKLHDESVMALDISHNSPRGISASVDSKIHIWSWDDENLINLFKTIEMTNPGVNSIRIRSDDKIFVCACWDDTVRVFSMKKCVALAILQAHKGAIRCVEFDDDNYVYMGSDDHIISVWDIYR